MATKKIGVSGRLWFHRHNLASRKDERDTCIAQVFCILIFGAFGGVFIIPIFVSFPLPEGPVQQQISPSGWYKSDPTHGRSKTKTKGFSRLNGIWL